MSMFHDIVHDIETAFPRFADFNSFLDDDFGYGIHPMDLLRPRHSASLAIQPRRSRWLNPALPYDRPQMLMRRRRTDKPTSDALMPHIGKDGFQVSVDVTQFKPNELTVKTVDNVVIVEGKHEEREDDHGLIQRHFIRKYTLPKDYDAKDVVSTISSDGVLTVKAPPPPSKAIKQNERIVQIQQTGPAHLSIKPPTDSGATAADSAAAANGAKNKMETGK